MPDNFNLYSKYYNLVYGDKDYTKEVEYVVEKIKQYAPGTQHILEFGSGTGGHGLLLQNKGYKVFGIERSEAMVAEAQKKGLSCKVADISNFELPDKYDAVISLFHVVSYLTSNESLIAAFSNANKYLKGDGVFLFDVWYTPAVYEQKALPRIKKIQNEEVAVTRFAEPAIDSNKNIVDVRFTLFAKDLATGETTEFFEDHPMRHFSIPEIELLARLTGFKIIKAEEFLTSNQPSTDTWGVCFILKKV
jgi:SAM-dependent methyltransferase